MAGLFAEAESKYKLFSTVGATDQQIADAEEKLQRKFSPDYIEYLKTYGAVSFGDVELTGLNIDKYANVVDVTLKEIKYNDCFPCDSIVLQNTGFEGLLVLIDENGSVFYWRNNKKGEEYNSFRDFILSLL